MSRPVFASLRRAVESAPLRRIHALHAACGGNDAATLVAMFAAGGFEDDGSLAGRLDVLLTATEHRWIPRLHTPLDVPGLHEIAGFSDRGFRPILRDPWPGSRDQIGHFLTATALALRPELMRRRRFGLPIRDLAGAPRAMSDREVALRFTIGHEKAPDPGRYDPWILLKLRRQFRSATDADVAHFREALARLRGRVRAEPMEIRGLVARVAVGEGEGNSIQDLTLSLAAFWFAGLVRDGSLRDRGDAAAWVQHHLVATSPDARGVDAVAPDESEGAPTRDTMSRA